MPISRSLSAAGSAAEYSGNCVKHEPRVLCRRSLRRIWEKFLQAFWFDARIFPKPYRNLFNSAEAVFRLLFLNNADNSLGKRQLMHQSYLSRQLKHGSMLAIISPASATVLPLSMWGIVGVFLKDGT